MKVIVHPRGEDSASALYRLIWPAEELQRQGHDIEVIHDRTYRALKRPGPVDNVVGLQGDIEGDVIVFQRLLRRETYELIPFLQERGIAVVVEIDDAFHCIPMHNPARQEVNPFNDPDRNYLWLERSCAIADWVTCTTDALAEHYAPHGRVSVIPNYMPRWYTEIPRPNNDIPIIGWTGTVQNHGRDLQVTKGAIGKLLESGIAQLGIVGTGKGVAKALNSAEPSMTTGWVSIDEYPRHMAQFDVGIVPLQDNRFNQSKSWLKVCEMAALGIPAIASLTPDNQKAAALGLCTLVESPEEWYTEALLLLTDTDWRMDRGQKARSIVRHSLILEDNAHQWLDAWRSAYCNRQAQTVTRTERELTNA